MAIMNMGAASTSGGGIPSTPSQHAFIMLGEKTLFLAHMTMFQMEEHCFQLVLRASLPPDAMSRFLEERHANPKVTYFLGNTPTDIFTVPAVKNGTTRTFHADIFRGIPYKKHYDEWPWNGVTPAIADVTVTVDRVVYYRHFDFKLSYPECLTYVLFGADGEAHMNHYQVKEPEFDHVLSLASAPSWLPEEDLEAGVHVNFPELRANPPYCENPIPEGTYQVLYAGQSELRPLEVGPSWWCETKVVNVNDPCPEMAAP